MLGFLKGYFEFLSSKSYILGFSCLKKHINTCKKNLLKIAMSANSGEGGQEALADSIRIHFFYVLPCTFLYCCASNSAIIVMIKKKHHRVILLFSHAIKKPQGKLAIKSALAAALGPLACSSRSTKA